MVRSRVRFSSKFSLLGKSSGRSCSAVRLWRFHLLLLLVFCFTINVYKLPSSVQSHMAGWVINPVDPCLLSSSAPLALSTKYEHLTDLLMWGGGGLEVTPAQSSWSLSSTSYWLYNVLRRRTSGNSLYCRRVATTRWEVPVAGKTWNNIQLLKLNLT